MVNGFIIECLYNGSLWLYGVVVRLVVNSVVNEPFIVVKG